MFLRPNQDACANEYGEVEHTDSWIRKHQKNHGIKIYRIDDISWYAAHNMMEFLNWYHKNIDSLTDPDEIKELEVIESEDGMMWYSENITQEDITELGDSDELCKGGLGDLKRRCGEIYKMQTFADVLGDEDIMEPYEIANTEW